MKELLQIKRNGLKPVLQLKYGTTGKGTQVPYLSFPSLEEIPEVIHGFSTRLGGVSERELFSMNLSYSRGDAPENVTENFCRIGDAIGFSTSDLVFSDQTHTKNVRIVTKEDCGKGIYRERDYHDIDGLITNEPGVVLATFYADCVPLYFVDPKKGAVGLSHSGWRGTVADIAGETVRRMQETYGTDPKDLAAAIGPSICQACYEVSEDVIEMVKEVYPEEVLPSLYTQNENGRYQLNLREACRQNFLRAGIRPDRIAVTDVCTCCNPKLLFSHRASKGKRGNLAAFLGLREKPDWRQKGD